MSGAKITARVFHLCLLSCCFFPAIGSLSLKPPAEEIPSKHLCPNPVLSATSKLSPSQLSKVLTIRLQPRNRSNGYFSRFRPCRFMEDPSLSLPPFPVSPPSLDPNSTASTPPPPLATLVRIQSINLNSSPWNFSASEECSKFIMFRSWSEYGNGYPVMCGRENFDQFLGPYDYPTILYYHLRDHGMSFPLFHPNYEPLLPPSTSSGSFPDQIRAHPIKYLVIYFSVRTPDGKWSCRLQQYTLNTLQTCEVSSSPICGTYPCNELNVLYEQKMGLLRGDSDLQQQQRYIIVKSKAQERYRVRNFLRQKFVPIVFLVILICAYKTYMKAGLRLHDQMPMPVSESRLRRHHHHHHRHHFRDIYFDYDRDTGSGGDTNLPGLHIPYEPSTPRPSHGPSTYGKYLAHPADPPPSYDTLFPPPPPQYNDLFIPSSSQSSTSSSPSTTTASPANPRV